MNEKKHIDRLFQERLKDFEAVPDDAAWDAIHDRLHGNKRKRRAIPIWWQVAGVAALLALLFTLGMRLTTHSFDANNTKTVVDTENRPSEMHNTTAEPQPNTTSETEGPIDNASKVASENGTDRPADETPIRNSQKEATAKQDPTAADNLQNRFAGTQGSDAEQKRSANHPADGTPSKHAGDQTKATNAPKEALATVVRGDDHEQDSNNKGLDIEKTPSERLNPMVDSKNVQNAVTDASKKMEDIIVEDATETIQKQSIEEAIAQADSEETETEDPEKKLSRWNISPNVAPVYFNSLGQGSSLDEQFVNNSKHGDITMSYGVGGSYAINDRLKVRAGINKVDLGYRTQNVIVYRSIGLLGQSDAHIASLNMDENVQNMTYLSSANMDRNDTPEIMNTKTQGAIDQHFGFIEVPLEVEYALVNKKVGLNLIGGFSTFIVDKNEVYSVVDGIQTRIGEANNINDMSYSANLGLGINYHISQKIKVNVEPTFKYQINTFSNSSGNFQPYFIGIYTGLSYKF